MELYIKLLTVQFASLMAEMYRGKPPPLLNQHPRCH
jgi:hypothetical protein